MQATVSCSTPIAPSRWEEDALGTLALRPRGLEGCAGLQLAHFERRGAHHAFLPVVPHWRTMHGKDT